MNSAYKNILSTIAATIVLFGAAYGIAVIAPYGGIDLHGAQANLHAPENPLVMKGHEVYVSQGCVYCHTQDLRPTAADVARFSDPEQYGEYQMPVAEETQFFSPSAMGSARIGPDLARLAAKSDRESLEALLRSAPDGSVRAGLHNYTNLFFDDNLSPLGLSWKIRMMMNAGIPFSDPYQRSVFLHLEGQTKGDALIEYLLFLGKRQKEFNGQYYQN